jgi:tripartite-type tricarboxylate transporter receptor subunit TctC
MGIRVAVRSTKFLAGLAIATALALPAHADSVEDFYKKTPVTMVLGYSVGGGFDAYARNVAKYIGNHIPGHPTIIVQNMPGAGSLAATNYVYNISPKDGSVISLIRAPVMEPLTGTNASVFDPTKFTWLGNGMTELTICAVLGNPKIQTMADARKTPFTMAGLGPGSDEDLFTKVLNHLFDMKARLVTGYPGGAEEILAVERGEVDGRCGWSYSSLMIAKPDWVKDKKLRILTALTLQRAPELPDTPAVMEFASTERQQQVLKLVIGCENLGRPFAAPPGVPADRAAALRKAFEDTMKDPAFAADRKLVGEDISFTSGEQIQALIKSFYAMPKDVLDETREMIAEK